MASFNRCISYIRMAEILLLIVLAALAMPSPLPVSPQQDSSNLAIMTESKLENKSAIVLNEKMPTLKRIKRDKFKKGKLLFYIPGHPVLGEDEEGTLVVPYIPETSWANAAYDKPGVYGAGWGTQYIHPVVIEVQGETTEPNYDIDASNFHNPGNWPKWVVKAMSVLQGTTTPSPATYP